MKIMLLLSKREMLINFRQLRSILTASIFYMMILVFFPLAIPADPALLQKIAPGLIWLSTLLAFLLSAEKLFQVDFEDGTLEQWIVSGHIFNQIIISKLFTTWLLNILPMLILSPLIAILYGYDVHIIMILLLTLLLGSPALFYLCALVAAFGVGIKQKGIFMGVLLMPLSLPILIFGSGTIQFALQNLPIQGNLAILAAISLLAMSLLPFAISGILRFGVSG
jgi:heme exporter protein B